MRKQVEESVAPGAAAGRNLVRQIDDAFEIKGALRLRQ